MNAHQVAIVDKTRRRIADRFEELHIPEPQESAQRLVDDLLRAGWRPWPALAEKIPPRQAAPSEVARQHLAEGREALEAKRGHRPELGDACTCRACTDGGAR